MSSSASAKQPRKNKYPLDIGRRGRKTGWQPEYNNIRKDDDGLDNLQDWFNSPNTVNNNGRTGSESVKSAVYYSLPNSENASPLDRYNDNNTRRSNYEEVDNRRRANDFKAYDDDFRGSPLGNRATTKSHGRQMVRDDFEEEEERASGFRKPQSLESSREPFDDGRDYHNRRPSGRRSTLREEVLDRAAFYDYEDDSREYRRAAPQTEPRRKSYHHGRLGRDEQDDGAELPPQRHSRQGDVANFDEPHVRRRFNSAQSIPSLRVRGDDYFDDGDYYDRTDMSSRPRHGYSNHRQTEFSRPPRYMNEREFGDRVPASHYVNRSRDYLDDRGDFGDNPFDDLKPRRRSSSTQITGKPFYSRRDLKDYDNIPVGRYDSYADYGADEYPESRPAAARKMSLPPPRTRNRHENEHRRQAKSRPTPLRTETSSDQAHETKQAYVKEEDDDEEEEVPVMPTEDVADNAGGVDHKKYEQEPYRRRSLRLSGTEEKSVELDETEDNDDGEVDDQESIDNDPQGGDVSEDAMSEPVDEDGGEMSPSPVPIADASNKEPLSREDLENEEDYRPDGYYATALPVDEALKPLYSEKLASFRAARERERAKHTEDDQENAAESNVPVYTDSTKVKTEYAEEVEEEEEVDIDVEHVHEPVDQVEDAAEDDRLSETSGPLEYGTQETELPAIEEEEEEANEAPATQPIPTTKPARKRKEKRARSVPSEVVNVDPSLLERAGSVMPDGTRKSARQRVEPLKWWDNERIVYKRSVRPPLGKREKMCLGLPTLTSVYREPTPAPGSPPPRKRRKPSTNTKTVIKIEKNVVDNSKKPTPFFNVKTTTGETESKQLVTSQAMITYQHTETEFSYAKTHEFGDLKSASTGFMILKPGGSKPNRSTKQNTLTFVVVCGRCDIQVGKTKASMGVGTQFSVPANNQYLLENNSKNETRLFWTCFTP